MARGEGEVLTGWALVTGASTGIGEAFSTRLAAEGRSLVLVARDGDRLERNAAELRARYTVEVEVLAADLTSDDGCAAVAHRIASAEQPVDTVVNNAGVGLREPFGQESLAAEEAMLDLNVRAVLRLSHAAALAMRPRGRGEIINISSTAGFAPRGRSATYAASKAWVTSFTAGLAIQLAGTGVTAAVICPGLTHTEFHRSAGRDPAGSTPRWLWLTPERVVLDGLAHVRAGRVVSVPSIRYRVFVVATRFVPRSVLSRAMIGR